ncbi:DNA repair protein RadA [Desulfitobacterium dichloroeliminans LMG P-21439]|uniref:DNA repair protein RadA n=1 Tax=Desulfitobacterium dichloroeliminans (strain LMG P-21439 / DCA1) TaxID=871963 RepID=L0F271_DESDL|nr:DNA repair protein RadA [Desulfitobacterium dichloroeliminans]AGA67949.1 DNA repair protein RadA [Desulfitobacterium dichloroeliminans LMG P-21439]
MAKIKTRFFCQACGQESARWLGKCPGCGEWNTLVEEILERSPSKRTSTGVRATPLTEIKLQEEERVSSGCQELNRVLGGGIVPGSFVLLGGEPGIGKSTLLLQTAGLLAKKMDVLYISGEESEKQIKLRAERLGITESHLHILTETRLDVIRDVAIAMKPGLLIVDSIQTMVLEELQAAAGSVSQVREGAAFLMRLAKEEEIPIFLVGHVTKEGAIAGPRVLEHIVDTVLYFEGDRHHVYRLLRAVKNRFGSTNEIGVFEMHEDGLIEVPNPSRVFLGENSSTAPGSSVAVVMEGSRPLLVEIQALVTPTTYGPPRRTATGIDYNRVLMLLAVLDKKVGFHLGAQDVFINIAGGIRIDEPGVDLACIAAIASSMRDRPLKRYAFIGEVGLTGEVRGIAQIENRVKEAMKLGFEGCILPQVNISAVKGTQSFTIIPVKTVEEAVQEMFEP